MLQSNFIHMVMLPSLPLISSIRVLCATETVHFAIIHPLTLTQILAICSFLCLYELNCSVDHMEVVLDSINNCIWII